MKSKLHKIVTIWEKISKAYETFIPQLGFCTPFFGKALIIKLIISYPMFSASNEIKIDPFF